VREEPEFVGQSLGVSSSITRGSGVKAGSVPAAVFSRPVDLFVFGIGLVAAFAAAGEFTFQARSFARGIAVFSSNTAVSRISPPSRFPVVNAFSARSLAVSKSLNTSAHGQQKNFPLGTESVSPWR
jgi:hypothetical protein